MVFTAFKQAKHFLGIGDISVEKLKARYSQDAYYLNVQGVDVRIKESGQGEPLLVLHGFSASADTWDGWRKELSDQFRVIAIDVPPFAITGPLLHTKTTPDVVVHFINAVVEKLGLTRFNLAGYARVAPLPVVLMRGKGIRHVAKLASPLPFIIHSVRTAYADSSRIPKGTIRRYQDLLRREGTRAAIADMMRGMSADPVLIKSIRVPTLIMWGAKDTWIPPQHGHHFQRDIAHSKLITYDDLGHIPMEEDPKRTAADARHFLTR